MPCLATPCPRLSSSFTDSLGLSVSEAYSRLKTACNLKWKLSFSAVAQEKNWVDPTCINRVFSVSRLPFRLFPLFYRLRTGALKIDHTAQNCTCGHVLNFDHIFGCHQILDSLTATKRILAKTNSVLTPSVLSVEMDDSCKLIECFVKELSRSPIGHLI